MIPRPIWNKIASSEQPTIDPKKFQVSQSVLAPAVTIVWANALANVDYRWGNIYKHPNLRLLRANHFFEPSVLMVDTPENPVWNSGRVIVYTISWLAIRAAWITRSMNRAPDDIALPKGQDWKNFLFNRVAIPLGIMGVAPSVPPPPSAPPAGGSQPLRFPRARGYSSVRGRGSGSHGRGSASRGGSTVHLASASASSSHPRKRQRTDNELDSVFRLSLSINGPIDIFWKGQRILSAQDLATGRLNISASTMKEIIWDLSEHNFRFELLALDRCVVPRDDMTDVELFQRDAMVRACLPGHTFVSVDWPLMDEGLGAREPVERAECLEAFRKLLATWPGRDGIQLKVMRVLVMDTPALRQATPESILAVEKVAYPFYCQTFFNYFGRAPSIPHQLPV